MGKVVRVRCPCCGHRLNQQDLHHPNIRLGVDDVLLQEIGGRGNIRNLARYSFDSRYGRIYGEYFLARLRMAERLLASLLGEIEEKIERAAAVPAVLANRLFASASFRAEPVSIVPNKVAKVGGWVNA